MRILIIDDSESHGETLTDLLNSRGHEAYFAPNLAEARWLLNLFPFSLALVDFDMPELTGPEVAEQLVASAPQIRVVVMSARQNDALRRKALGNLPFLPKPIRLEEMLHLIDALDQERSGSSLVRRVSFAIRRYTGRER